MEVLGEMEIAASASIEVALGTIPRSSFVPQRVVGRLAQCDTQTSAFVWSKTNSWQLPYNARFPKLNIMQSITKVKL